MGQGAGKPVAAVAAGPAKEVAYRTVLVGGKVQKIPIQVGVVLCVLAGERERVD